MKRIKLLVKRIGLGTIFISIGPLATFFGMTAQADSGNTKLHCFCYGVTGCNSNLSKVGSRRLEVVVNFKSQRAAIFSFGSKLPHRDSVFEIRKSKKGDFYQTDFWNLELGKRLEQSDGTELIKATLEPLYSSSDSAISEELLRALYLKPTNLYCQYRKN